jgi:anoctamin-10
LINNWVELRSDAVKICVEMQRPIPWRADSIGPWLDSLGFLAWFGSVTSAALVFLFRGEGLGPEGTPWNINVWALLLTIAFSEHIYFAVRIAVRNALQKMETPGQIAQERERYIVRKRYIEDTIEDDAKFKQLAAEKAPVLNRDSVEEDARKTSSAGANPGDKFWQYQQSWEEAAKIGSTIIRRSAPAKEDKKEL